MKLKVNKFKNDMDEILKKIIIWGFREVSKICVLGHFSEMAHQKFLNFCMMLQGSRRDHMIISYPGKVLIHEYRGTQCQRWGF